jgi:hypothetical protein
MHRTVVRSGGRRALPSRSVNFSPLRVTVLEFEEPSPVE